MYKNLESFVEWLKSVAKAEVDEWYIKATLEELKQQNCETGNAIYELSRFETKSGNPETYSYDYEIRQADIIYIF